MDQHNRAYLARYCGIEAYHLSVSAYRQHGQGTLWVCNELAVLKQLARFLSYCESAYCTNVRSPSIDGKSVHASGLVACRSQLSCNSYARSKPPIDNSGDRQRRTNGSERMQHSPGTCSKPVACRKEFSREYSDTKINRAHDFLPLPMHIPDAFTLNPLSTESHLVSP